MATLDTSKFSYLVLFFENRTTSATALRVSGGKRVRSPKTRMQTPRSIIFSLERNFRSTNIVRYKTWICDTHYIYIWDNAVQKLKENFNFQVSWKLLETFQIQFLSQDCFLNVKINQVWSYFSSIILAIFCLVNSINWSTSSSDLLKFSILNAYTVTS